MSAGGHDDLVYLDHHATTPVDPRVLERMLPFFGPGYGNASVRAHGPGRRAAEAVEAARAAVAALVGATPAQVIFTSGATESNYLALLGLAPPVAPPRERARGHVITSLGEHKSTLDAVAQLEARGLDVDRVAPDPDGIVTPDAVAAALRADTTLVSLMLVNNEIGTINPLGAISARLTGSDALVHSDGAQAAGRVPVDVRALGVDLLSLSAHKVYGPKGVGALIVSDRARGRLRPSMPGGGQEGGLRGGTLNVPGIVGFGAACELAATLLHAEAARVRALRDALLARLRAAIPELRVNGSLDLRVGGNLSVTVPGIDGEALLREVGRDVALTSGAACSAGRGDASHVLTALGLSDADARATLRMCVGRTTTEADIARAGDVIVAAVDALRRRPAPSVTPDLGSPAPTREGAFEVRPIGVVRNAIVEPTYIEWGAVRSHIDITDEAQRAALFGLDGYSHVIVVCWLHLVEAAKTTHTPQGLVGVVPQVGMFACRCPYRANPIAVTTVRLVALDDTGLVVEGLDAVDGTPVLDLKPYTPRTDAPTGEVRYPDWVDRLVL